MGGVTTPRAPGQPKVMTNRLANMKFMQRAAASSPLSANTTTSTPEQPSAKRQKVANGASTPTSTGTSTPNSIAGDQTPKLSWNAAGETEWVLSLPKPVASNQTFTAESSDEEDGLWSASRTIGRQTYGSFKRRKSTLATSTAVGDEELSSLDSGEEEDMHPLRPLKRPTTREQDEEAEGRRLDSMNLSRMGGVSGSASLTGAGMSKRNDGKKGRDRYTPYQGKGVHQKARGGNENRKNDRNGHRKRTTT